MENNKMKTILDEIQKDHKFLPVELDIIRNAIKNAFEAGRIMKGKYSAPKPEFKFETFDDYYTSKW